MIALSAVLRLHHSACQTATEVCSKGCEVEFVDNCVPFHARGARQPAAPSSTAQQYRR